MGSRGPSNVELVKGKLYWLSIYRQDDAVYKFDGTNLSGDLASFSSANRAYPIRLLRIAYLSNWGIRPLTEAEETLICLKQESI